MLSEVEMTECLENFYISQAELDKSQKNFFNTLANWDEDKQYIVIAKTKLKKSNQEFIKYHNLQCDFAYFSVLGQLEMTEYKMKSLFTLKY